MPIEIKNKSGDVIYTHEDANLWGADLQDADLRDARLNGIQVNENTKF